MRFFRHLFLFTCSFILLNLNLRADREVDDSIALSEKLNELEMYDLSFYLLKKTIAENPDFTDFLRVQEAQTFYAMRNDEKAKKILDSIPTSSTAYAFARFVLGISLIGRGKNEEGCRALEEYCAFMKNNMPKRGSSLDKQFEKAVSYLIFAYRKDGKVDELQKVMKYIEWPRAGEDGNDKPPGVEEGYEEVIMNAQIKLDAAEMLKQNNKPGWKEIIIGKEEPVDPKKPKGPKKEGGIIKELKGVYWSGQTAYSALAAIELTKAYCLLERYEEGLKELKTYMNLIKSLDDGYREQGFVPPSSKAYLWRANINWEQGEKATVKDERVKFFLSAANDYLYIIAKYDQEKCQYTGKAVAGFNKANDAIFKETGKKIKVPPSINIPKGFNRKKADDMFAKDRYKEAIPLYMEVLQTEGARSSQDAPDLLNRAAFSYLKTGKILESLALATYLGEYFPESKDTPMALLRVGETLWKEYKKSPATPKGKTSQNEALMIYKIYLKNCPTHEFADEIAVKTAQVYYNRATDYFRKADKLKGEARAKKIEEARQAFRDAIPIYQQILDNYLHTDLGKKSAYQLAWCYTNSKQYKKGAEVFATFADAEYGREKKEKRDFGLIADAKFRVAENYTRAAADVEKELKKLKKQVENAPSEATLKAAPPPKKGKTAPLSEEAIRKLIDEKTKEAIELFTISATNLDELLNKWIKPGGRLTEATKPSHKKKIKEIENKAASSYAWAIDGTRDNKKAIKAFKNFVEKYPKNKDVAKSMLRLGMLYIQEEMPNEAAKTLDELSSKFPEEGKKALPKLARTMYKIEEYDKSVDTVKKIFAGDTSELPVSDLKWIARRIYDCEGRYPKEGASLSLQACEILNTKIKKPVLSDWIGIEKARAIEGNKEEIAKMIAILKDQMLFYTGNAAFRAGEYEKAIGALNILLEKKDSPYFLPGHFTRAESFMGNGEPKKALEQDFNEISLYLYKAQVPPSVSYKNQCMIGEAYILCEDYGRALGAYNFVAMTVINLGDEKETGVTEKEYTPAELKKQRDWLDYAVFMAAVCENELENKDKVKQMQDLYKINFPTGKYKARIDVLPKPAEAIKLRK